MGYALMPLFEDEAQTEREKKVAYHREDCIHRDCKEIRELRKKKCNICGKGFKPLDAFYVDNNGEPQHAKCVIEKDEN